MRGHRPVGRDTAIIYDSPVEVHTIYRVFSHTEISHAAKKNIQRGQTHYHLPDRDWDTETSLE